MLEVHTQQYIFNKQGVVINLPNTLRTIVNRLIWSSIRIGRIADEIGNTIRLEVISTEARQSILHHRDTNCVKWSCPTSAIQTHAHGNGIVCFSKGHSFSMTIRSKGATIDTQVLSQCLFTINTDTRFILVIIVHIINGLCTLSVIRNQIIGCILKACQDHLVVIG